MLNARAAVGGLKELSASQHLLLHGKGAVVCAYGIQRALLEPLPERLPVRVLAQRRAHYELHTVGVPIPVVREQQVLGAGLKVYLLSPRPRPLGLDKALLG